MSLRLCTRVYTANSSFNFKDQLNNWCDRVHISHIKYSTHATTYRDQQGHLLYQAFPIFPHVGVAAAAQYYYDERVKNPLTSEHLIGWGTSKKEAEEMAAQRLLESRQYCFY